jgi:hypothetical protein
MHSVLLPTDGNLFRVRQGGTASHQPMPSATVPGTDALCSGPPGMLPVPDLTDSVPAPRCSCAQVPTGMRRALHQLDAPVPAPTEAPCSIQPCSSTSSAPEPMLQLSFNWCPFLLQQRHLFQFDRRACTSFNTSSSSTQLSVPKMSPTNAPEISTNVAPGQI